MNDAQLGYIAGLVDGEGTISISYRRRKQYGDSQARILFAIYNSNMDLLHFVKSMLGGSIHVCYRGEKWKPSGSWRCGDARAAQILSSLLPYLVAKRAQAILAIKFQSTKMMPGSPRKKGLSKKILNLRARIVGDLRNLNQRGKHAS